VLDRALVERARLGDEPRVASLLRFAHPPRRPAPRAGAPRCRAGCVKCRMRRFDALLTRRAAGRLGADACAVDSKGLGWSALHYAAMQVAPRPRCVSARPRPRWRNGRCPAINPDGSRGAIWSGPPL
jgi:hypothetical protein